MPPLAAALPSLIAAGGGIASSLLAGRLSGREKAAVGTVDPLVEDIIGSETKIMGGAPRLVGEGVTGLEKTQNFWQKILSGDRAAVQSATGPLESDISRVYSGATRGMGEFAPRGGGTSTVAAGGRFAEAGEIARAKEGLFAAAPGGLEQVSQALAQLGQGQEALGAEMLGQAISAKLGELDFLGGRSAQAQETGLIAGQGLGQLLFKMMNPTSTTTPFPHQDYPSIPPIPGPIIPPEPTLPMPPYDPNAPWASPPSVPPYGGGE